MQLISGSYFSRSVVVKGQKARLFSVCKNYALISTLEDWIMGELRNLFCEITDNLYSWWVGVSNRQPENIQESHLHICMCRVHTVLPWSSLFSLPYTASNTGSHMGRVEWWHCTEKKRAQGQLLQLWHWIIPNFREVLWFNPSWPLNPTQPFTLSPMAGQMRESEK